MFPFHLALLQFPLPSVKLRVGVTADGVVCCGLPESPSPSFVSGVLLEQGHAYLFMVLSDCFSLNGSVAYLLQTIRSSKPK